MNEKINRNDPCPCGSGKKYKKCCGANEAVGITHLLEKEMDDLQKQILHFALIHYDVELEDNFEGLEEEILIQDDVIREFYFFLLATWFTLFERFEDGKTILEKFIASEGKRIQRPKLRQILQTWTNARAIVGIVRQRNGNNLTIAEGITGNVIDTVVVNSEFLIDEDEVFLGFLLPYEQKEVFFAGPFTIPDVSLEMVMEYIYRDSKEIGFEDPQEYVQEFFVELMNDLMMLRNREMDLEALEWPSLVHKKVAETFIESLETFDEDSDVIETGVLVWYRFCMVRQKRIKNPNLYAAALHYLVSTIAPMEVEMTQKELADHYGVSPGSISPIYQELASFLQEEMFDMDMFDGHESMGEARPFPNPILTERVMREALGELDHLQFESLEEANRVINQKLNAPKKAPQTSKERAQEMVYDAFEADGPLRFKLAKDALKLDPNCVDAYTILAEGAPNMEKSASLYKKGMEIGQKEFGENYFKKHRGHFWGLYETRPFMRAKFSYAQALLHLEKREEAIKQMVELLELNPMDNQGVRFFLFIAYVDNGELEKARKLLDEFNEGFARGMFNRALIEVLENGFTPEAAKLVKEGKKENKHIIPYLLGKKRLPSEQPSYYSMGDESEAIIYADEHLHIWREIPGLIAWLEKL
ncbi:SEC-C metal-binding domain-containing protein [Neobacillus sp. SM06]|uniref:SEC-C metal-binding domain-containing protein n=1 Tax=Neobacillus sp. SM06 TaxID=3422492 RepID=UPI003D27EED4